MQKPIYGLSGISDFADDIHAAIKNAIHVSREIELSANATAAFQAMLTFQQFENNGLPAFNVIRISDDNGKNPIGCFAATCGLSIAGFIDLFSTFTAYLQNAGYILEYLHSDHPDPLPPSYRALSVANPYAVDFVLKRGVS